MRHNCTALILGLEDGTFVCLAEAGHYSEQKYAVITVDSVRLGNAVFSNDRGYTYDGVENRKISKNVSEEVQAYIRYRYDSYTAEELEFAAQISAEAGFDNKGEYFTGLEPLEDQPVPLAIGTDVSDVSHTVPTIMLSAAAMCKGTPLHHWAATAQAGMSIGRKGMVYAAECMAAGAYRLVKDPEFLDRAWREFRGQE